jgi:hypothetical protein
LWFINYSVTDPLSDKVLGTSITGVLADPVSEVVGGTVSIVGVFELSEPVSDDGGESTTGVIID